jgi:hypothetical protein
VSFVVSGRHEDKFSFYRYPIFPAPLTKEDFHTNFRVSFLFPLRMHLLFAGDHIESENYFG